MSKSLTLACTFTNTKIGLQGCIILSAEFKRAIINKYLVCSMLEHVYRSRLKNVGLVFQWMLPTTQSMNSPPPKKQIQTIFLLIFQSLIVFSVAAIEYNFDTQIYIIPSLEKQVCQPLEISCMVQKYLVTLCVIRVCLVLWSCILSP